METNVPVFLGMRGNVESQTAGNTANVPVMVGYLIHARVLEYM